MTLLAAKSSYPCVSTLPADVHPGFYKRAISVNPARHPPHRTLAQCRNHPPLLSAAAFQTTLLGPSPDNCSVKIQGNVITVDPDQLESPSNEKRNSGQKSTHFHVLENIIYPAYRKIANQQTLNLLKAPKSTLSLQTQNVSKCVGSRINFRHGSSSWFHTPWRTAVAGIPSLRTSDGEVLAWNLKNRKTYLSEEECRPWTL